jgi:hypothetical protein
MRTLVGSTDTGVAAAVTLPGYFVQIDFPTPWYRSTRGTLSWNGQSWVSFDAQIAGLATDGAGSALNGTLIIGNTDLAISTEILLYGISGRVIKIWKFYGDTAPALGDPVQIFEGIGDDADIPENGSVRVALIQSGATTLFCPRTYLTASAGFNWLPTPGKIVTWNGETVRLDAEGF